jgi:hypothetical protein
MDVESYLSRLNTKVAAEHWILSWDLNKKTLLAKKDREE